jgi:hypothetical protein
MVKRAMCRVFGHKWGEWLVEQFSVVIPIPVTRRTCKRCGNTTTRV